MRNELPRIFISHSSADRAFVDWLADGLTSFGLPIWYDKWEIMVGDSIIGKINEGLKTADYLAVVLSRASVYNTPQKLDRGLRWMLACHSKRGGEVWQGISGDDMMVLLRPELL